MTDALCCNRAKAAAFAAPPAPITVQRVFLRFPQTAKSGLAIPKISVLNPEIFFSSNRMVLTAPILLEAGSRQEQKEAIFSLKGAVMFIPLKPIDWAINKASSAESAPILVYLAGRLFAEKI